MALSSEPPRPDPLFASSDVLALTLEAPLGTVSKRRPRKTTEIYGALIVETAARK